MCIHCEVDCGGACVCCHLYKEAIIRIEKLAEFYDKSGDQDLWRVGQDIYTALDGDK